MLIIVDVVLTIASEIWTNFFETNMYDLQNIYSIRDFFFLNSLFLYFSLQFCRRNVKFLVDDNDSDNNEIFEKNLITSSFDKAIQQIYLKRFLLVFVTIQWNVFNKTSRIDQHEEAFFMRLYDRSNDRDLMFIRQQDKIFSLTWRFVLMIIVRVFMLKKNLFSVKELMK